MSKRFKLILIGRLQALRVRSSATVALMTIGLVQGLNAPAIAQAQSAVAVRSAGSESLTTVEVGVASPGMNYRSEEELIRQMAQTASAPRSGSPAVAVQTSRQKASMAVSAAMGQDNAAGNVAHGRLANSSQASALEVVAPIKVASLRNADVMEPLMAPASMATPLPPLAALTTGRSTPPLSSGVLEDGGMTASQMIARSASAQGGWNLPAPIMSPPQEMVYSSPQAAYGQAPLSYSQPQYGQSQYGQPQLYAQAPQPYYAQAPQPYYAQAPQPYYAQAPQPYYAQAPQPYYAQAPQPYYPPAPQGYGQMPQGSNPYYGQMPQSPYGQPAQGLYSQPLPPGYYGQPAPNPYGQMPMSGYYSQPQPSAYYAQPLMPRFTPPVVRMQQRSPLMAQPVYGQQPQPIYYGQPQPMPGQVVTDQMSAPLMIPSSPGGLPAASTEASGLKPPSRPLIKSTAMSKPSLILQGVYQFQADQSSARARLTGSYPITPNLLFGSSLDVTTGRGFSDSPNDGFNINELFLTASLPQVPNLRLSAGQLDLTSYFDRNSFAKDGATHFFNPTFQTNPALSTSGLSSRPGVLLNWALSDNIEAKAAAFSSSRGVGDFAFDGFAGELGLRYGNTIIRGTYVTDRDSGNKDGFKEIRQLSRGLGRFGTLPTDRESSFGINAETFFPNKKMGVFARYGRYNNLDLGQGGDTFSGGVSFLDVFSSDDRLGVAYGRGLSNDKLRARADGSRPDALEVFYDFRFMPNLRLGFSLQGRNDFSEIVGGIRVKTEFDVTPKGRLMQ